MWNFFDCLNSNLCGILQHTNSYSSRNHFLCAHGCVCVCLCVWLASKYHLWFFVLVVLWFGYFIFFRWMNATCLEINLLCVLFTKIYHVDERHEWILHCKLVLSLLAFQVASDINSILLKLFLSFLVVIVLIYWNLLASISFVSLFLWSPTLSQIVRNALRYILFWWLLTYAFCKKCFGPSISEVKKSSFYSQK